MQYPLINGNRFDFSSVEFIIGTKRYAGGVKEVSYDHALTPGELRGNHAPLIGRTRGKYEANGSMTVFKSEYQQIITDLGPGYLEKAFDLQMLYSEPGSPVIQDVLRGCRIKKDADTGSEGGEASEVKVELHPMMLFRNGLAPLSRT